MSSEANVQSAPPPQPPRKRRLAASSPSASLAPSQGPSTSGMSSTADIQAMPPPPPPRERKLAASSPSNSASLAPSPRPSSSTANIQAMPPPPLPHERKLAQSSPSASLAPPQGPSTSGMVSTANIQGPSTSGIVLTANVQAAREKLQGTDQDSIEFRLLNALLTHAPTAKGVDIIASDIIAASSEQDGLKLLAEFYKTGLLLPMKAGGQTPLVSFHPSRDAEIQGQREEIAVDLEAAKRDKRVLKAYTLERDGYRCLVTNQWDVSSLSKSYVQKRYNHETDSNTTTQACHILPYSLMSFDKNKALFKKATIWAVIESFTNVTFEELNGNNINSLTNVITLDTAIHSFFGPLDLWFEAVPDVPNTYKVKKARPNDLKNLVKEDTVVTFTSTSPDTFPLPDPRYIAFHAAVAGIVHIAGMAEHLDEIIRDYATIRVLSDDSSAEYLDGLLRIAQRSAVIETY